MHEKVIISHSFSWKLASQLHMLKFVDSYFSEMLYKPFINQDL